MFAGELRISNTNRTVAWEKATANGLLDTILTWGAEEEATSQPVLVDVGAVTAAFTLGSVTVGIGVAVGLNAILFQADLGTVTVQEGNVMVGRHLTITGKGISPFATGTPLTPGATGIAKSVNVEGE